MDARLQCAERIRQHKAHAQYPRLTLVRLFARLLSPGGGVRAILVNERGAEQRIVGHLERRGATGATVSYLNK